jgi:hypothetical protein
LLLRDNVWEFQAGRRANEFDHLLFEHHSCHFAQQRQQMRARIHMSKNMRFEIFGEIAPSVSRNAKLAVQTPDLQTKRQIHIIKTDKTAPTNKQNPTTNLFPNTAKTVQRPLIQINNVSHTHQQRFA